jgi:hypothetical protein
MTAITWYKRYHRTAYNPKFRTAANLAGSTHCNALGVWDALLEESSENEEDRGSLINVDLRVVAAGLDLALDEVQRIWDAFISLGMLVAERIAKWAKRQGTNLGSPARPVTSGALRQRKYIRRKKADERQGTLDLGVTVTLGVTEGVTPAVTVTPESESEKNKGGTPLSPPLQGGEDAMRPRLLIDNSGGKDGRGPRGSRLPIDWQPGPEDRFFAANLGLDPDDTAAEFRDYWCPKSRARSLDWSAEWRTHCRRKCERQRPRPGRRSPHQALWDAGRSLIARYERAERLSPGEPADLDCA